MFFKVITAVYSDKYDTEPRVKISGSHCRKCEETLFWDVTPCSLVESDPSLRDAYCRHHHGDAEFVNVTVDGM
jgi:hypothetical protein